MIEVRFGTATEATFTSLEAGLTVAFTVGAAFESPFAGRFPEARTWTLTSFFGAAGVFVSATVLTAAFGAGLLATFNGGAFDVTALILGFSDFADDLVGGFAAGTGFLRAGFVSIFFVAGLSEFALT